MTFKGDYGQSSSGNFSVIDSIGVPHPYCITPKHVVFASDHRGGMLDGSAIEDAEKAGAKCDTCKGRLKYKEHETALLVSCKVDPKEAETELREWLLSIKDEATRNNYVGFAFMKSKG